MKKKGKFFKRPCKQHVLSRAKHHPVQRKADRPFISDATRTISEPSEAWYIQTKPVKKVVIVDTNYRPTPEVNRILRME